MFRQPQQTARVGENFSMKMPKAPERPLVPYMRYSRKMWPKVRAENPEAQLWDISKIIGQMWKEVPDSEKAVYQHEYDVEKVEYDKLLKAHQNSSQYQSYMSAKNRQGSGKAEKASRARVDGGGVVIQSVDEDDFSTQLVSRRLSAIRYDRNHRLIAELFNSTIVTDSRAVVAQQRIDMLKKQALSLLSHQNKLEEELHKLHDTFSDRKRRIETSSDDFALQLKKVCEEKPGMDSAGYEKKVEEWQAHLKEAYSEYIKREEELAARLTAERERMAEKTPVLYGLTIDSPSNNKAVENGDKLEPASAVS